MSDEKELKIKEGAATILGMHLYNKFKSKEGGRVPEDQKTVGEELQISKLVPAINEKAKNGTWVTFRGRRIFIRNKKS